MQNLQKFRLIVFYAIFWNNFFQVVLGIDMERARHLRERDSEGGIGRDWKTRRTEGMHFTLKESSSEQVRPQKLI